MITKQNIVERKPAEFRSRSQRNRQSRKYCSFVQRKLDGEALDSNFSALSIVI